jgi:putative transposase
MKTARYGDAQTMGILRQAESGVPVSELCREHGKSSASFYKWRSKYGGMDASMVSQMSKRRFRPYSGTVRGNRLEAGSAAT